MNRDGREIRMPAETIPEGSSVTLSEEVYRYMLIQVPEGRITRWEDIEAYLARKFGVHHIKEFDRSVMTQRMFANGDAEYLSRVFDQTPEHREVSSIGYISETSEKVEKLMAEGLPSERKGKDKKLAVKDYKKYLFDFDNETNIDIETLKKIDREGLYEYLA